MIKCKSCKDCINKTSCDAWRDKHETMLSGWDKNRLANGCNEHKEAEK